MGRLGTIDHVLFHLIIIFAIKTRFRLNNVEPDNINEIILVKREANDSVQPFTCPKGEKIHYKISGNQSNETKYSKKKKPNFFLIYELVRENMTLTRNSACTNRILEGQIKCGNSSLPVSQSLYVNQISFKPSPDAPLSGRSQIKHQSHVTDMHE